MLHYGLIIIGQLYVCNIDGFECRMRKMCFKFRERLTSNNSIIMNVNVNDNMWIISNYMWRKWTDILYKGAFKW